MTHENILSLGWEYDNNLDSEASYNLYLEHGFSKGYTIDTQDFNGVCLILYHFPDDLVIIESIIDCGVDLQFLGIISSVPQLQEVMHQIKVTIGRF